MDRNTAGKRWQEPRRREAAGLWGGFLSAPIIGAFVQSSSFGLSAWHRPWESVVCRHTVAEDYTTGIMIGKDTRSTSTLEVSLGSSITSPTHHPALLEQPCSSACVTTGFRGRAHSSPKNGRPGMGVVYETAPLWNRLHQKKKRYRLLLQ